ncbi:MAG: orotidine-5'-phosphate decarboxylase [Planctomycetota bacterium]
MTTHFADRLDAAIRQKDVAACVGLDPLLDRLPAELQREHGIEPESQQQPEVAASALRAFGSEVIKAIAPHVPAIKINIAFFERYRAPGVSAYFQLVRDAQRAGLVVIGDVKRADIGHTSTQYAQAAFSDHEVEGDVPDAITVNPYFGIDGVGPFIDVAAREGRGVFVLVQTSNESAAEVQGLELSDGSTLVSRVARLVQGWAAAEGMVGSCGYSLVGAVVSPRDLDSTVEVRGLMPNCVFLVPGFGAQGRTADEVRRCFRDDGTGALVTASRSVIYAYSDDRYRHLENWRQSIESSCRDLVQSIRRVTRS